MFYKHLTRDDRVGLGILLRAGHSFRSCAKLMGFTHPVISLEVNGNDGRDGYNPYKAHRKAKERRYEANQCHRKWQRGNWRTDRAISLLNDEWSPDQIAGRSGVELKTKLFAASTIYSNVNPDKDLRKLLPRKGNKYRRTKAGNDRKRAREALDSRKSIDARPNGAETRKRIGHWEGDTIIGKEKTARILTHVERKTGYLIANLLYNVTADKIRVESVRAFINIPKNKKKTVTYDRGTEFGDYELTEKEVEMLFYFAHAYHSWERGTNENTNGLIRRYFPKGTFFSNISDEQLNKVVIKINHRPRKRLGYKTPYEVFNSVKLRMLI